MHVLDIISAAICILFVAVGIRRGLIGELVRLFALIGGLIGAFTLSSVVCRMVPDFGLTTSIRHTLCFMIAFLAVAAAIFSVGWVVKKIVHFTLLGWIDRLSGALVGVLKTILLLWVCSLVITSVPNRSLQRYFESSIVFSLFSKLPPRIPMPRRAQELTRQLIDSSSMQKLKETQQRVERFKQMIDSAKALKDSLE
jgi:membrane protein required for colicin V production